MNELISLDLERMIRAHLILTMYEASVQVVAQNNWKDQTIAKVLLLVNQMFAVKQLLVSHTALYETGFFERGSVTLLEQAFKKLLVQLRPHMLGLVEWFSVGDVIPSVIGNKYGDIYEAQLEFSQKSRLNEHQVPPFYEKYMKPTMTMHKPKL